MSFISRITPCPCHLDWVQKVSELIKTYIWFDKDFKIYIVIILTHPFN
jgi:hypothetical protein